MRNVASANVPWKWFQALLHRGGLHITFAFRTEGWVLGEKTQINYLLPTFSARHRFVGVCIRTAGVV